MQNYLTDDQQSEARNEGVLMAAATLLSILMVLGENNLPRCLQSGQRM